jgi:hypothetical protein
MSSHAPFEPFAASDKHQRMWTHLRHHREELCGADMLAAGAARYVAEIYPAGDLFATDCTRTAVAVFFYLTGKMEPLMQGPTARLHGMPCPSVTASAPQVLYLNLVGGTCASKFDTRRGHRLTVVLSKGRARVMHAFKDRFTLHAHMRSTGSLSQAEWEAWWAKLQKALWEDDSAQRAALWEEVLGRGVDFRESVEASWMCSAPIDLGFSGV